MANEDIYQSIEGIGGPSRQNLIDAAITYALGRTDWELIEVADRGRYLDFPDGTEVFLFDSAPLLKFRLLMVEQLGNPNQTRTHYQYEILYDHNPYM